MSDYCYSCEAIRRSGYSYRCESCREDYYHNYGPNYNYESDYNSSFNFSKQQSDSEKVEIPKNIKINEEFEVYLNGIYIKLRRVK